jgi:hypothetical protein
MVDAVPRKANQLDGKTAYATRMEDSNEPTKVTVWMPRYAKRALKEEAARRDMTMGEIILESLKVRIMFFETKEGGK